MIRNVLSVVTMVGIAGTAAAENKYVAADNSPITKLCVSAAVDSKTKFNLNMHRSHLTDRYIRKNISCNGVEIAQFAKEAGNLPNYYMLEAKPNVRVDIYQTSQRNKDSKDRVIMVAGN